MASEKRLIDANAFFEEHCADCKYFRVNGICTKDDPVCGSAMIVAELPTIDAVEVVRCKDCKSWEQYNACDGTKSHRCMNHDAIFYKRTNPDDFCSYGERKDNDRKAE